MTLRTLKILLLIPLLSASGCATTTYYAGGFREGLVRADYDGALISLKQARKGPNRLLYFVEKGLVEHYRGDYRQSNDSFERAERLSDRLFTRSLSREAAALLTSDAIRDYRGEAFERAFIHYYRALNYWYLGLPEDALVECRKANLKLARLASGAGEGTAYRNDAFLHYATGLFYEAAGELNDAYVSYRDAQKAYGVYEKTFGVPPPPALSDDLARVAESLGVGDDGAPLPASPNPNVEVRMTEGRNPLDPRPSTDGELVLFCETGFVPQKVQEEVSLPIFEEDLQRGGRPGLFEGEGGSRKGFEGDIRAFSRLIASRYQAVYPGDLRLKYWLRVALPAYRETPARARSVRLSSSGRSVEANLAEDLSAIARLTFEDQRPVILARTVARGVSKYAASEAAKKKNKYLGFFANLFTAATETADTRSWLSLPHSVRIGRLRLPEGVHDITVEALDARGEVVETKILPGVQVRAGQRTLLSCRTYE